DRAPRIDVLQHRAQRRVLVVEVRAQPVEQRRDRLTRRIRQRGAVAALYALARSGGGPPQRLMVGQALGADLERLRRERRADATDVHSADAAAREVSRPRPRRRARGARRGRSAWYRADRADDGGAEVGAEAPGLASPSTS